MNLISLSLSSLVRTAYSGSPPLAKQTSLTTESFTFHISHEQYFSKRSTRGCTPTLQQITLVEYVYPAPRIVGQRKFLCFQLMMWLVVFLLFQTQTCFSLRSFKAPDLALCLVYLHNKSTRNYTVLYLLQED